jgi:hypothetical protein
VGSTCACRVWCSPRPTNFSEPCVHELPSPLKTNRPPDDSAPQGHNTTPLASLGKHGIKAAAAAGGCKPKVKLPAGVAGPGTSPPPSPYDFDFNSDGEEMGGGRRRGGKGKGAAVAAGKRKGRRAAGQEESSKEDGGELSSGEGEGGDDSDGDFHPRCGASKRGRRPAAGVRDRGSKGRGKQAVAADEEQDGVPAAATVKRGKGGEKGRVSEKQGAKQAVAAAAEAKAPAASPAAAAGSGRAARGAKLKVQEIARMPLGRAFLLWGAVVHAVFNTHALPLQCKPPRSVARDMPPSIHSNCLQTHPPRPWRRSSARSWALPAATPRTRSTCHPQPTVQSPQWHSRRLRPGRAAGARAP